jgi:ketol-acid reductoisomerase
MKIEINFTQSQIFEFLQKQGYEVKSWLWQFTDETFPGGITSHESWTFTACKTGEIQSEERIYTKVLNKEIKQILEQIK